MQEFKAEEHQHVRYNPLKDEWILVSPHRLLRPWQGQTEDPQQLSIPRFDPGNPLCPGVTRPNGIMTPNYESTYVFTNDFPALMEEGPEAPKPEDDLFITRTAKGTCRVMCYHPHSDKYLYSMSVEEVVAVIDEWQKQTEELGSKYTWVQVFENKGQIMGCSNPHPHCQIWASNFLPNEGRLKDDNMRKYYQKHNSRLLDDYTQKELVKRERIVCENEDWVIVVPYWAVWPFETMVLPKKSIKRMTDLDEHQKLALAKILRELIIKYDNLFKCSFPYSMGWHGAPTGPGLDEDQEHWTFHGVYLPPLVRSSTVKKFMVGYEMLAQSQRDLTPEKAAAMIRSQSCVHYTMNL